jgi:hypothetical protein
MTTEEAKQQVSEASTETVAPEAPTADELVDGLGKRDEPKVAMTLRERAAAWWRGEDALDPSVPVLAPGTTPANA